MWAPQNISHKGKAGTCRHLSVCRTSVLPDSCFLSDRILSLVSLPNSMTICLPFYWLCDYLFDCISRRVCTSVRPSSERWFVSDCDVRPDVHCDTTTGCGYGLQDTYIHRNIKNSAPCNNYLVSDVIFSVFGIAESVYRRPEFDFRQGQEIFLFSTASYRTCTGGSFPGGKVAGNKNDWVKPPLPHTSSWYST
jgi:hypothetical protein